MDIQLPSSSNTKGSAAGVLAGSLAVGWLSNAAFTMTAAAAIGVTPVALAGIGGILATALVNYAVTHWAEMQVINKVVENLPKTYPEYPKGKNGV